MAPVMIGLIVGICWLDSRDNEARYLLALALVLGTRCVWELVQLLRARSLQPDLATTMACSLAVIAATWMSRWCSSSHPLPFSELAGPMFAYVASVLALFFVACMRYREPGKNLTNLGSELIVVTYVGLLLSFVVQLRWPGKVNWSYLPLGSLIVATKCGDIGAYTLGRLFGKKKMVPLLSPGKTWMGAWGAVLGATAGSVAWFQFGSQMFAKPGQAPCEWYWSALLGAILGVVGLIGDLAESLIKRDVGAKDAPALIPGFGGLLDVLDSILYAGPVAYILWLVLPLAPR
jgi:phosphatidate cytidylyltransferase